VRCFPNRQLYAEQMYNRPPGSGSPSFGAGLRLHAALRPGGEFPSMSGSGRPAYAAGTSAPGGPDRLAGAGRCLNCRPEMPDRSGPRGVHADTIAEREWPGEGSAHAYEAAKMAAAERSACIDERRSFASETVFSHRSKLELIGEAKAAGYVVWLHVCMLPGLRRSGLGNHHPCELRRWAWLAPAAPSLYPPGRPTLRIWPADPSPSRLGWPTAPPRDAVGCC